MEISNSFKQILKLWRLISWPERGPDVSVYLSEFVDQISKFTIKYGLKLNETIQQQVSIYLIETPQSQNMKKQSMIKKVNYNFIIIKNKI